MKVVGTSSSTRATINSAPFLLLFSIIEKFGIMVW